jgi:CheY-like chemotaxis protein
MIERSTVRSDQPTAARELAAHSSPGRALIGKRILLVDDDPAVRDSPNDVLVPEGCVVIPAENGQQALDLAAGFAVDLALLDLNMPVKNGWDTFEQLTFVHPLIPVIIVTARPSQLFTALAVGAGLCWKNRWTSRHCCERWKNFWRNLPGNAWRVWLAEIQNTITSPQRRDRGAAARQNIVDEFK